MALAAFSAQVDVLIAMHFTVVQVVTPLTHLLLVSVAQLAVARVI